MYAYVQNSPHTTQILSLVCIDIVFFGTSKILEYTSYSVELVLRRKKTRTKVINKNLSQGCSKINKKKTCYPL